MYRGRTSYGEFLGVDRESADVLREVNELRRSRSLPEYPPNTPAVGTLTRRSLCRRVCRRVRASRV